MGKKTAAKSQRDAASCTGRIIKETNDTSACVWVLLHVCSHVLCVRRPNFLQLQVGMVTSAGQRRVLHLGFIPGVKLKQLDAPCWLQYS